MVQRSIQPSYGTSFATWSSYVEYNILLELPGKLTAGQVWKKSPTNFTKLISTLSFSTFVCVIWNVDVRVPCAVCSVEMKYFWKQLINLLQTIDQQSLNQIGTSHKLNVFQQMLLLHLIQTTSCKSRKNQRWEEKNGNFIIYSLLLSLKNSIENKFQATVATCWKWKMKRKPPSGRRWSISYEKIENLAKIRLLFNHFHLFVIT